MEIKEIDVLELRKLMQENKDFTLIDVRNPDEYQYCNLGGALIPMSEILERYSEIPKQGKVIIYCHHGSRSRKVIDWLQANLGYENLYNLSGGIHSWSINLDSAVPIY